MNADERQVSFHLTAPEKVVAALPDCQVSRWEEEQVATSPSQLPVI